MKLVQSILTNNPCYTAGRKITVKGLMLHSVGCNQPSASVFIRLWNKSSYNNACVHGFIDANDGTIYQTLPWNHRGWHAGGSANNTHIGVEMCEPDCISYTKGNSYIMTDAAKAKAAIKRTYDAAVELFAYLCKQYNLDPLADGVIVSHKEGNKRGIASNHGDPEHLWNGCGLGYTMDGFRKAVKAAMGGTLNVTTKEETKTTSTATTAWYRVRKSWSDASSQIGAFKDLALAKQCVDNHSGYSVFDPNGKKIYPEDKTVASTSYLVKITASVLNVRTGAGTSYPIKTTVKKGDVYTIVEENNGWGKLKSGAGWICLDYTTKY